MPSELDFDLGGLSDHEEVVGWDYPHTDAHPRYPGFYPSNHEAIVWVVLNRGFEITLLSPVIPEDHEVGMFINETGLDNLFDIPSAYKKVENKNPALSYDYPVGQYKWAKENGLSPNQPFQVSLYARHYISHGPDGDEGDCDTGVEILQVMLLPKAKKELLWKIHELNLIDYENQRTADLEYNLEQMVCRTKLMYLVFNTQNPTWASVSLKSRFHKHRLDDDARYATYRPDNTLAYASLQFPERNAYRDYKATIALLISGLEAKLETTYPQILACLLLQGKPLTSISSYTHEPPVVTR